MKSRNRKCCWLVDSVQRYVTFSPLCSFSSSIRRDRVWMGSFRRQEPIMSSRYSNMPSSCSVWPLGFIMAICSTSPYIWSIKAYEQRHVSQEKIKGQSSKQNSNIFKVQLNTNFKNCKKKKNNNNLWSTNLQGYFWHTHTHTNTHTHTLTGTYSVLQAVASIQKKRALK